MNDKFKPYILKHTRETITVGSVILTADPPDDDGDTWFRAAESRGTSFCRQARGGWYMSGGSASGTSPEECVARAAASLLALMGESKES